MTMDCVCATINEASRLSPLFGEDWYKFPHPTKPDCKFVIKCKDEQKSTPIKMTFDILKRTLSLEMRFCLLTDDNKIV